MFQTIALILNLISLAIFSLTPYKNGHPALSTVLAVAGMAAESKTFFEFISKCQGWAILLIILAVIFSRMVLLARLLIRVSAAVRSIFARIPPAGLQATVETPCEPYKEESASLPTPPASLRLLRPRRQPPPSPLITPMVDPTKYYWQRPLNCTHASCKAGAMKSTKCEKGAISQFMKEQWELASPSTSKDSSTKSNSPEALSPLSDTSMADSKSSMSSLLASFAELPSTLLFLFRLFIRLILAIYSALTPEQWRKVYANLLVLLAVHLWSSGGEAPKMREHAGLDVLSYHLVPDVQHWARLQISARSLDSGLVPHGFRDGWTRWLREVCRSKALTR